MQCKCVLCLVGADCETTNTRQGLLWFNTPIVVDAGEQLARHIAGVCLPMVCNVCVMGGCAVLAGVLLVRVSFTTVSFVNVVFIFFVLFIELLGIELLPVVVV